MALGLTALGSAQSAPASTDQWTVLSPDGLIAAKGSFGVKALVGCFNQGDTFSGVSSLTFASQYNLVMHFSGFGNPCTTDLSPMTMRLRMEMDGVGIVFDGDAVSLNSKAINIPASGGSSPIGIRLIRNLTASSKVPAGQYTNQGVITFTRM